MSTGLTAEILVLRGVPNYFTFEVPAHLISTAIPGSKVTIPFGKGRSEGIIMSLHEDATSEHRLKPIEEVSEGMTLPSNGLQTTTKRLPISPIKPSSAPKKHDSRILVSRQNFMNSKTHTPSPASRTSRSKNYFTSPLRIPRSSTVLPAAVKPNCICKWPII